MNVNGSMDSKCDRLTVSCTNECDRLSGELIRECLLHQFGQFCDETCDVERGNKCIKNSRICNKFGMKKTATKISILHLSNSKPKVHFRNYIMNLLILSLLII